MADLYDLGERPPLGLVPKQMHAYAVRQSRFGQPRDAWKREVLPTPTIGPDEVLIYVMASGINFNNVWAALGTPVDVIGERQKTGEPEDFHAGGSDCSGIVWAVGRDVRNVAVGDEVIVHSGWWRPDDPWVLAGKDPMLAESTRIWGYQTNYGSYCQFARAQAHQCLRQGRVGRARRADEPAHRVRASGRGDLADLGLSLRHGRDDRDLRGHDRLQRHDGSALSLDAAEALPGQSPLERRTGRRSDRARGRGASRPVSVKDLPLRRHPALPSAHAGQQAP